jgi:hypothetical protein
MVAVGRQALPLHGQWRFHVPVPVPEHKEIQIHVAGLSNLA